MSIPQKRLSVKRSPSLVLQSGQQSIAAAELVDLINSTQTKLDEEETGKRTFFEDFMLEHSHSDEEATSMEFAGSF